MDLKRDPVVNTIYNGIKRDIRVALENKCWRAALILVFSGIDAMAFLAMPPGKEEVTREDFENWVERYISLDAREKISGTEFYSARCAIIHTYGSESRLTRAGVARQVVFVVGGPPVKANPVVSKELVALEISAFADAFFRGIDDFLVEAFADAERAKLVGERLQKFVHEFPIDIKQMNP